MAAHDADARIASVRFRLEGIGAIPLAKAIAKRHGRVLDAVLGTKRTKSLSRARAELAAVLRWTLHLSYPEIGDILRVDHTTVIWMEKLRGAELERFHGDLGYWSEVVQKRRARENRRCA